MNEEIVKEMNRKEKEKGRDELRKVELNESNQAIGLMSRVLANGPGDWCSIPGRVIPKTQKMVLESALLNKVRIKGKEKQSREWSSALSYTSV